MIGALALFAAGWYLGIGTAFGFWYYIEDDFDDPWWMRLCAGSLLMVVWGLALVAVVVQEDVIGR